MSPDRSGRRCRVLVVEDDRTIAGNLFEYLEAQGHDVDIAYDGGAALARLGSETFDVVVLDLGLPRVDGMEVLQHLRGRLGLATPVLLLTARDRIESKAAGFRAGADDYLTKPFSLVEVGLRVGALHRRAGGEMAPQVLRAGPLRFDRRTRELRVGERPLRLMPRSVRLIELLMRDPGRVVTRAELEAALWPDDPPETDALRSQIHILRRALAQAGFEGVETVPKVGYRLRCEATANDA
jgi:DNA-binding response OmpR family regulator